MDRVILVNPATSWPASRWPGLVQLVGAVSDDVYHRAFPYAIFAPLAIGARLESATLSVEGVSEFVKVSSQAVEASWKLGLAVGA